MMAIKDGAPTSAGSVMAIKPPVRSANGGGPLERRAVPPERVAGARARTVAAAGLCQGEDRRAGNVNQNRLGTGGLRLRAP